RRCPIAPTVAVEIIAVLINIGISIGVAAVVDGAEIADLRQDVSFAVEARLGVKAPVDPIQSAFRSEVGDPALRDRAVTHGQAGSGSRRWGDLKAKGADAKRYKHANKLLRGSKQ